MINWLTYISEPSYNILQAYSTIDLKQNFKFGSRIRPKNKKMSYLGSSPVVNLVYKYVEWLDYK